MAHCLRFGRYRCGTWARCGTALLLPAATSATSSPPAAVTRIAPGHGFTVPTPPATGAERTATAARTVTDLHGVNPRLVQRGQLRGCLQQCASAAATACECAATACEVAVAAQTTTTGMARTVKRCGCARATVERCVFLVTTLCRCSHSVEVI